MADKALASGQPKIMKSSAAVSPDVQAKDEITGINSTPMMKSLHGGVLIRVSQARAILKKFAANRNQFGRAHVVCKVKIGPDRPEKRKIWKNSRIHNRE